MKLKNEGRVDLNFNFKYAFFSFTNMFSATTISKCACLRLFIVENQGIHIHIIAACIYVIKQRLITERKLYSIHGRDFTNMFSFETRFETLCLVYIYKGWNIVANNTKFHVQIKLL